MKKWGLGERANNANMTSALCKKREGTRKEWERSQSWKKIKEFPKSLLQAYWKKLIASNNATATHIKNDRMWLPFIQNKLKGIIFDNF